MIKNLKIYKSMIHISFKSMSMYRTTTFLVLIFGIIFTFIDVITTLIFFQYTDHLAGYSFFEVLLIIGIYDSVQNLYQIFFINAHEDLSDKVIEGELDYDLLRPINTNFYINYRTIDIPSIFNLIVSIIIIIYSTLHINLSYLDYISVILILIVGTILYSYINQLIVNLCFWIEKPGILLGVPEYLFDLVSRPSGIYPKYISFVLTFIIPMFLITNSSVYAIKNDYPYTIIFFILLIYIILFKLIINYQWRKGILKYNSTN